MLFEYGQWTCADLLFCQQQLAKVGETAHKANVHIVAPRRLEKKCLFLQVDPGKRVLIWRLALVPHTCVVSLGLGLATAALSGVSPSTCLNPVNALCSDTTQSGLASPTTSPTFTVYHLYLCHPNPVTRRFLPSLSFSIIHYRLVEHLPNFQPSDFPIDHNKGPLGSQTD